MESFFLFAIFIHYFLYREFSSPTWKRSTHLKCQFPPKTPFFIVRFLLDQGMHEAGLQHWSTIFFLRRSDWVLKFYYKCIILSHLQYLLNIFFLGIILFIFIFYCFHCKEKFLQTSNHCKYYVANVTACFLLSLMPITDIALVGNKSVF